MELNVIDTVENSVGFSKLFIWLIRLNKNQSFSCFQLSNHIYPLLKADCSDRNEFNLNWNVYFLGNIFAIILWNCVILFHLICSVNLPACLLMCVIFIYHSIIFINLSRLCSSWNWSLLGLHSETITNAFGHHFIFWRIKQNGKLLEFVSHFIECHIMY